MAVTVTKEGDVFRFSGRAFDITKAKNEALEPYGCRVHNYGLVLELIPDDSQRAGFAQQIGNARFMRNQYLNDRIAYYKETRKTLPVDVYKKKYFPKLKEQYSFLTLSDKFALESAIEHVDTAYKNFFEGRAAFPKFASNLLLSAAKIGKKRYRTHGGSVSMKSVCVACRNPCPERSMTRKPTPALKTGRKPNKK